MRLTQTLWQSRKRIRQAGFQKIEKGYPSFQICCSWTTVIQEKQECHWNQTLKFPSSLGLVYSQIARENRTPFPLCCIRHQIDTFWIFYEKLSWFFRERRLPVALSWIRSEEPLADLHSFTQLRIMKDFRSTVLGTWRATFVQTFQACFSTVKLFGF